MRGGQKKAIPSEPGFTLAEVIVVGAIVATLAAVAVPIYTGYLAGQRQSVVDNLASTAAVAANSYYRRYNQNPDSSRLGLFLPVPGKFKIAVSGTNVIVRDASDLSITATVPFR